VRTMRCTVPPSMTKFWPNAFVGCTPIDAASLRMSLAPSSARNGAAPGVLEVPGVSGVPVFALSMANRAEGQLKSRWPHVGHCVFQLLRAYNNCAR